MIEIFTRKAVYPDLQLLDIVLKISHQQMNPSSQLPEWLNEEMKQFFTKNCFAFDPNERSGFKVTKKNSKA